MRTGRILAGLLIVSMVLTACGNTADQAGNASYTRYSPREIAETIIASQTGIAAMNPLDPDDEHFWYFLAERYFIDADEIEVSDGIIMYAGGVIADEIAVLLLADENDAPAVRDLLLEYVGRRMRLFSTYAPVQAAILADSVVSVNGRHVALLISEDPQGVEAAFLSCFSGSPPSTQEGHYTISVVPREAGPPPEGGGNPAPDYPGEVSGNSGMRERVLMGSPDPPDIFATGYDPESILLAWNSGDTSDLTSMNYRILDKCRYVIDSEITEDMDDLEKKFAILRWIIIWSVYDPEFLSNSPTAEPDPNNDNPYGLLFSQVANCFGFAYTFQLFMELLGIECITVHGYDFTDGRHSWSLVYIDGLWSAVDVTLEVTLNNPLGVDACHVPDSIIHKYANLSSDYLWEERGHRWDLDSVPEAFER